VYGSTAPLINLGIKWKLSGQWSSGHSLTTFQSGRMLLVSTNMSLSELQNQYGYSGKGNISCFSWRSKKIIWLSSSHPNQYRMSYPDSQRRRTKENAWE